MDNILARLKHMTKTYFNYKPRGIIMRLKVNVTQHHIDVGRQGVCNKCPIALAVLEAVHLCSDIQDEVGSPSVGKRSISWRLYKDDKTRYVFKCSDTPRSVKRFIKAFDAGKPVKPFSFWLNIQ